MVEQPSLDRLDDLLKRVSRSFYLTLKVLPADLRAPIGLAYLFARAADTIADTALISPADRLTRLEQLRSLWRDYDASVLTALRSALIDAQRIPAEGELLRRLDECFALLHRCAADDQARICHLLQTLTQGMILDLSTFPAEQDGRLIAFKTYQDLDQYVYYVAGCVGAFWTEMSVAHRPALRDWPVDVMRQWGIHFGKGLQLTNIIRDLAHDLRLGRCYLPLEALEPYGLQPEHLLAPSAIERVRPLLHDLLARTREHYRWGWAYALALPRREVQMRLACAWPLLIGCRTLDVVAKADNLLDPSVTLKISRQALYRLLLSSILLVFSNRGLQGYAVLLGGQNVF